MNKSTKHNQKKSKIIYSHYTDKAFTIVEVMIVLVVIGTISTLTYQVTQSKANYFRTRYMAYSAYTNLKNGINQIVAAGCTSPNLAVCPKPTDLSLPIVGHDTNSPPLGLCDRLISSSTNNGIFNTMGTPDCTLTTSSNFSATNANFIATNGMMFYNFGSPPVNSYFTVYIDMDGSAQGKSSTTTDVLTFIIGNDGSIYPAYGTVAATNPAYLPSSVSYITNGNYVGVANGIDYQTAYCDVYGSYPPNNTPCTKSPACNTFSCTFSVNKPPGMQ